MSLRVGSQFELFGDSRDATRGMIDGIVSNRRLLYRTILRVLAENIAPVDGNTFFRSFIAYVLQVDWV